MKTSLVKNEEPADLGSYIKGVTDQEMKVLLLKLKNEIRKEDVLWEQIKDILAAIGKKDEQTLKYIAPLLLD